MIPDTPALRGVIGESYARIAFLREGWRTYTADVDDHGVDFIARSLQGKFYDVQVKQTGPSVYPSVKQNKFRADPSFLFCAVCMIDGAHPDIYLAAGTDWGRVEYPCLGFNPGGGDFGPYYELKVGQKYANSLQALEFEKYIKTLA